MFREERRCFQQREGVVSHSPFPAAGSPPSPSFGPVNPSPASCETVEMLKKNNTNMGGNHQMPVSAFSASQCASCLPAHLGPVCPVPTLSEIYFVHSESTIDRPTQPSSALRSEAYLPDGGDHIFVLLSAQKFLDAEVELLQQLFISWQTERGTQPGQHLTQLVPDGKVSGGRGKKVNRANLQHSSSSGTGTALPDIGNRVVDQLQRRDQEVLVEVFSGENFSGCLANIKKPQAVPVAPPLSQI